MRSTTTFGYASEQHPDLPSQANAGSNFSLAVYWQNLLGNTAIGFKSFSGGSQNAGSGILRLGFGPSLLTKVFSDMEFEISCLYFSEELFENGNTLNGRRGFSGLFGLRKTHSLQSNLLLSWGSFFSYNYYHSSPFKLSTQAAKQNVKLIDPTLKNTYTKGLDISLSFLF